MYKIFGVPMPVFTNILERNDLIDTLYSAVRTDDLAEAVMTAFDIINNKSMVQMTEHFEKTVKCEQSSYKCRLRGNEYLHKIMYREALIWYNIALLLAPANTESMILSLSNRSALLLQIGAMDACLKDIELCQTMKCSAEIIRKLEERKAKCKVLISKDKLNTEEHTFVRDYFKLDVKRNKDIPCASEDVEVVKDNGLTKIIAARDIQLGKVVAIEPAFVAVLDKENYFTSCHYCHKMTLNLIPCDGCCKALFCDEDCKKQCFKEYHKVECQIIDVIDKAASTGKCKLPIVAALKIREMSDSWKDLVSYSLKIGKRGMEKSSLSAIYNEANIKSVLNFNDDKHFIHGKMFNQCFLYAIIVKHLSDIPNYLPQDGKKRTEAQRALARIMLSLYLKFPCELDILSSALEINTNKIGTMAQPNSGLFSFASKLTHSCTPNLLYAGLGNKLALIAVKYIKKGTELTISFIGHWCETFYTDIRPKSLFHKAEIKCQCRACIENWKFLTEAKPASLTKEQKNCYRKFLSMASVSSTSGDQFRETCFALKVFQDFGNTREFNTIFQDFRKRLVLFQSLFTQNVCIDPQLR